VNAEERARIIAEYLLGGPQWHQKFLVRHIRAAQYEAMEKCLTYIETAWFDKDGMLIAVDGKDFLDDVRNTLIKQLGKK